MKRKKKSLFLVAIMATFALILSACSSQSSSSGEGGDLIIASHSEAVSLDPHGSNDVPSSNVAYNIYETLVKFNEKMEIVPGLAEEWEPVNDTTWEFKIREGVKFHDGSDLNAEVVKANFDRLLDPDVGSPRAFLYEMVTNVEVVDEFTVRFTLEYPFAPFPAHLAHSGGSIISLEAIKKDYEAMENGEVAGTYISPNPSGTGYFKLDEWVSGDYMKLVRNEDYWGDKAKLASVTWKVVDEPLTRIAELERGNSHISDPVSPSDMKRVNDLDNASVVSQTSLSLAYIGFNTQKAPFDNVKVRQAISHAVDKQQIIDGIYEGTGVPAVGPLAPGVWGFDESVSPLEHDLEKAKQLLEEAGFGDGFSTTIWTNDNPDRMKMAEYVQASLSELNIDVKIEVLEWATYLEQTAAGNHDMFILGWSTATADADYATYPLFHSNNVGDPGNRSFLEDSELDTILADARVETDEDARRALYKEAQEKLVELAPMIYLLHTDLMAGVSDDVKGFGITPSGLFELQNVTIEK